MTEAKTQNLSKLTYSAKDYIQDGLFHQWDGIENAGWHKHDSSATVWKDLVGGDDFQFPSVMSFDDKSLRSDVANYGSTTKSLTTIDDDGWTAELVFFSNGKEINQYQSVFFNTTGQFRFYMKYNTTSPALYFQNNTAGAIGSVLNGKLDGWQHVIVRGFVKPDGFPGSTERYVLSYDVDGNEFYRSVSFGPDGAPVFEENWIGFYALTRLQLGNLAGRFFAVRYYNRVLSDEEILHNNEVDAWRFGV